MLYYCGYGISTKLRISASEFNGFVRISDYGIRRTQFDASMCSTIGGWSGVVGGVVTGVWLVLDSCYLASTLGSATFPFF